MKRVLTVSALLLLLATNLYAAGEPQPEAITGKMAVKFGRGLTNVVTSVVEIPRQTVLLGREMGGVGYLLGPFSGVMMTGYRALMGVAEMVLFPVPAPGYYDPMIDPAFVWVGRGPKRQQMVTQPEAPPAEPATDTQSP